MATTSGLSTSEAFVLGGVAACCAVTISNPAEVAKTRLQLQGELGGGVKLYNNTFDVLRKTVKNEGVRGIQRGLGPAYVYQVMVNGARLGFYEPLRRNTNRLIGLAPTDQNPFTSLFAGASSGIIGASFGNPMFLLKARMQASGGQSGRYNYTSSLSALRTILKEEGPLGLVRGINTMVLRTGVGSAVQVPSYLWTKSQIVSHGLLPADSFWTFLLSSTVSGFSVLMVMQPMDTVLTRMYNQPTTTLPSGKVVGALYRNPFDGLKKILVAEGIKGWYKGVFAHFLRITPHTIMVLTVNDLIVGLYKRSRDGR